MSAFAVKTSRVLLTSAARTANTNAAQQTDTAASALRLYLNVTAASGTGGLYVVLRGYDKVSQNTVELTQGGDPVNQTGCYAYEISLAPDPPAGNLKDAVSRSIPYQWDALVKHLDGSSYTYSLSAEIVM
jgi:hypothetical protein